MRAASSAATLRARAASREPMVTAWPAAARRNTRPLPCAPVPPSTEIAYSCRSAMIPRPSVSNDEQVFDRNELGDEVLLDHVLHERLKRRPVGFHRVGRRNAAEHAVNLSYV